MASPWDFDTIWREHTLDYPTFNLTSADSVSGIGKCKYLALGTVRKMVSVLGGLNHLNGQIVSVQADGLDVGDQVVTDNQIILSTIAGTVHAGLSYAWTFQFLPLGGDGQTVNQAKERKVFDVVLRVYKSLGGQFGKDTAKLYDIDYVAVENINRNPDDNVLFTGDLIVGFESSVLNYWTPVLTGNRPVPFQLLAAIIRSEINEEK